MNFVYVFGLFCLIILASHLEHNQNELIEEKSMLENLSYGPMQEIMSHLEEKDIQHLSASSKEFLKYDQREVVLKLPLTASKEPSNFLCEHLKTRKRLVIKKKNKLENDIKKENLLFMLKKHFKGDFDKKHSNRIDYLTMKYLKCLSGIEDLSFGPSIEDYKILADPDFKVSELFPKLKKMQFKLHVDIPLSIIPDYLKSLELNFNSFRYEDEEEIRNKKVKMKRVQMGHFKHPLYNFLFGHRYLDLNIQEEKFYSKELELKEKIAQMNQLENLFLIFSDSTENGPLVSLPMISELQNLGSLKRVSIRFIGKSFIIDKILSQTKQADYFLDLEITAYDHFDTADLLKTIPKKTESLDLDIFKIEDTERFCTHLSFLNHLKKLNLYSKEIIKNFDCFLQSFPNSLKELTYSGNLYINNLSKITLPKGLHTVNLEEINSIVFETLARHVHLLKAKISDPENILNIKKPFTTLKVLGLEFSFTQTTELKILLHILNLLPMKMDGVGFEVKLQNEKDFYALEEKILTFGKQIAEIDIFVSIYSSDIDFYRYEFDGSKMVKIR